MTETYLYSLGVLEHPSPASKNVRVGRVLRVLRVIPLCVTVAVIAVRASTCAGCSIRFCNQWLRSGLKGDTLVRDDLFHKRGIQRKGLLTSNWISLMELLHVSTFLIHFYHQSIVLDLQLTNGQELDALPFRSQSHGLENAPARHLLGSPGVWLRWRHLPWQRKKAPWVGPNMCWSSILTTYQVFGFMDFVVSFEFFICLVLSSHPKNCGSSAHSMQGMEFGK